MGAKGRNCQEAHAGKEECMIKKKKENKIRPPSNYKGMSVMSARM